MTFTALTMKLFLLKRIFKPQKKKIIKAVEKASEGWREAFNKGDAKAAASFANRQSGRALTWTRSLKTRALAALAKGTSLFLMGIWVAATTLYQVFVLGVPQAAVMGSIGFLALAVNLASVLLLVRYKDGDANVRSVWLCSRNDAIGNVAVMLAAAGVWGTASAWPDLIVAGLMAALFVSSSVQILSQAIKEYRHKTEHEVAAE